MILGTIQPVPKKWIAERSSPKFWASASYCIPMEHCTRVGEPDGFIQTKMGSLPKWTPIPAYMCWFFFPDGTNTTNSVAKKFFEKNT